MQREHGRQAYRVTLRMEIGMIKDKKKIIIICSVIAALAVLIVAICVIVGVINKKDNNVTQHMNEVQQEGGTYEAESASSDFNGDNQQNSSGTESGDKETKPVRITSLDKLKQAYSNGDIDTNTYFQQLLYIGYDSELLDSAYKSETSATVMAGELGIEEFYEANKDSLSDAVKSSYVDYVCMDNVSLKLKDTTGADNSNNYTIHSSNLNGANNLLFASVGDTTGINVSKSEPVTWKKSDVRNHTLDKVYLSSGRNFLIWYTDTGADAVSEDSVALIATRLENDISIFEENFGVKYKYEAKVDNGFFSDDKSDAKKIMKACGVDVSYVKTAMSVYIYDMGMEGIMGMHTYNTPRGLDIEAIRGEHNDDGYVNYPYMRLNKGELTEENREEFLKVASHELFHQVQHTYAYDKTGEYSNAPNTIMESTANYAAVLTGADGVTDTVMNDWVTYYTTNTMEDININPGKEYSDGYAIFPYIYSFVNKVHNGYGILMDAHTDSTGLGYLQDKTTTEQRITVINDLAYNTLTQNYLYSGFLSGEPVTLEKELQSNRNYYETIKKGAIRYYKLNSYMNIKATSEDVPYVSFNIYGKKGGNWSKIYDGSDSLNICMDGYSDYEELYLVVTNCDLKEECSYKIEMGEAVMVPNISKFNTTYSGYRINIDMSINVAGVETKTETSGVVDELHQKEHLITQTKAFGMTLSTMETYIDYASGCTYTSTTAPTTQGTTWEKESSPIRMMDLKVILDKLNSMKDVEKVSDGQYKVKMSATEVQGLINSGATDGAANNQYIYGTMDVDVYVENGYVTKLYYDFSRLSSALGRFTATVTLSDYNRVEDVSIPKQVEDEAISR